MADGIPPAHDFNIALSAVDPRDVEYSAVAVSWIEDGPVPDEYRLGIDGRGRVCQPWAWAAGIDTWRRYPPQAQVLARTVHMLRPPGCEVRIFEERRYGRLPQALDQDSMMVPRWLPKVEMRPAPVRGKRSHPMDDVPMQRAETPGQSLAFNFQRLLPARPNRNPMNSDLCLPVQPQQRFYGACGHPGCRMAADIVGLNRVCEGCAELDPTCTRFSCGNCWTRTELY